MATRIGPDGVCEFETNTYDNDGKSASIIDIINNRRETLFFRGITAGSGITVNLVDTAYPDGLGYSTGKTIQISSSGGGSSSDVSVTDAGKTGTSIIGSAGVSNNTIPFRTIAVDTGLQLTEKDDVITISTEAGLGAKWFVITTTTPDNTVGNDGDMLINSSGEIFNKVSGAWVDSSVNIKGPKGDIGATPTFTVGTTTTGAAGSKATVTIDSTSTAENIILDFTIPQGQEGIAGTGLSNKGDWVSGTTYTSGDYVFAKTSDTDSSTSMFIYKGDGSTPSTTEPADDTTNWVEFTAPSGQRGSLWTVSTSTTAPTSVSGGQINDQYLAGDGKVYSLTSIATDGTQTWTAGISLVGPKGDTGTSGTDGKDGISPTVTVGTTTTGAAGSEASVTVDSTSTSTSTILNFAIPQGPAGAAGAEGTAGTNGKDGAKWFYNKSATDGSSLKSEGGNVGDYCLIGTGEIYTLTAIDASGNETWTDSGINITGPAGAKGDTGATGDAGAKGDTGATGATGTAGAKWYLGTLSSPTVSTISTDPVLSGVTVNNGDMYLGQDDYVYEYSSSAWTKSTTYLGGSSSGTTVEFNSTGTALGTVANNTATVYSLVGGAGVSLSTGSNEVTISTTGTTISSQVGSTVTSGITTLVQGSNVTFDSTTTSGSLIISSTGGSGSSTLQSLTDVSSTNPQTGNILQYNSGSSKWVATAPSFTLASNISDVQISSPANSQILQYNLTDAKWENTTLSVPVDNISGTLYVSKGGTGQTSFTENGVVIGNGTNGLSVTSAPTADGDVLTWNGTEYTWTIPTGSGGGNTTTYAISVGYSGNADGGCTALNLPTGWTASPMPGSGSPQTSTTITTTLTDDDNLTWVTLLDNGTLPMAYTGNCTKSGNKITLQIDSGTTSFDNTTGKGYIIFTTSSGFPALVS